MHPVILQQFAAEVLLSTPGHAAGSVSLLVRRDARLPLLLAGNLTYAADRLQRGGFPAPATGASWPSPPARYSRWQSTSRGLVVLPAHDTAAARRLLDS